MGGFTKGTYFFWLMNSLIVKYFTSSIIETHMYSNDTRAFIDPINKLSNYTIIDTDLDKV